jgi:hypothetical protein
MSERHRLKITQSCVGILIDVFVPQTSERGRMTFTGHIRLRRMYPATQKSMSFRHPKIDSSLHLTDEPKTPHGEKHKTNDFINNENTREI